MRGLLVRLRKTSTRPYQITSLYPMPPRFEVTFRVRQYGERWSIAVGVITEYRKDKQSSGDQDERESAGLVSNSRDERGSVWVDGVCQF